MGFEEATQTQWISVDKYKARLVAKNFRKRKNIDFFDTFSPITRITSIRVFISIAETHRL